MTAISISIEPAVPPATLPAGIARLLRYIAASRRLRRYPGTRRQRSGRAMRWLDTYASHTGR